MKSAKARLVLSVTCPHCLKVNGLRGLPEDDDKWLKVGAEKACTYCERVFEVMPARGGR